MFNRRSAVAGVAALAVLVSSAAHAQTIIQDDFTDGNSTFDWKTYNGACMTAGDGTGTIPKCVGLAYYNGQTLYGGNSGTLPDPVGYGALRFTNGNNSGSGFANGFNQAGSIISNFTFPTGQGLQITFETLTYRGDSGGSGKDGADGMAFFLMDGAVSPYDTGAYGGSLGYTCSNANNDPTVRADGTTRGYDGLIGGYLGLGIDEYGNFLNGVTNTLGESGTTASGDNTASGGGYQPGRIGLRGAGSIAWGWLNATYPTLYPSSLTLAQKAASVKNTCHNGYLTDYNNNALKDSANNKIAVADYNAIPNAYKVLSSVKIANESAVKRGDATPIVYNLKITQDGLLSLAYSYNGGAYQPVITSQSITASNGALPTSFRFGFAGSTGGSTNIHEILCFKAAPSETSSSSGSINVYQNPTIKTGTQLFLAYYFPSDWSGQLTAQNVLFDTTLNTVVIGTVPNWDARCVLTGVTAATGKCSTGATSMTAEAPDKRTIMTWDGTKGIPFLWANLTSAQQTALDSGDATPINANRLNYLRGDRTNEITSTGTGLYRARKSVLGDIVNSSPTWSGPPQLPYDKVNPWVDQLYPSMTQPENSGEAYTTFQTNRAGRLNVVFVGANDGFLHGFRAGSLDTNGNLVDNSTTPNDGNEVLAYMPGAVLQSIHNSSDTTLDFANTQYAHNYYVDATPATGDVFYNGLWHTWLVGGLGAGGAAIYALDVTHPALFTEANAATIVKGEWTATSLTCVNVSNCGTYLGNTFGTPQIRRFHNGQWGAIFGNGFGSAKGTAGIYIMLIDSSGATSVYYLAASSSTTGNGIANPASLDIDLDHVVDYVYGGDLLGNVWRFDVTSKDPNAWAVSSSSPLFSAGSAQPITTRLAVGTLKSVTTTQNLAGIRLSNDPQRVIVNFGTGRQIPQTVTNPTTYATGSQYLYGIWDWDMDAWNALSSYQQAISLKAPQSVTVSTLQQQTITTIAASGSTLSYRTISHTPVCWKGGTGCTPASVYGWYMLLPGTSEQVIFDPILSPDGELVVNTFIPSPSSPLNCKAGQSSGYSMGMAPDTGQGSPSPYFYLNTNLSADGVQLNGVGMPALLSSGQTADQNAEYFITQTTGGAAPPTKVNRHVIVTGARLNWLQRR
jgi:type IV pilus assembly protein PilY1